MNTFYDYVDEGYFDYHGSDDPYFILDGKCFMAPENEYDSYQSYLGPIKEMEIPGRDFRINRSLVARVIVREFNDNNEEGFQLVDKEGKIWLSFGTANIHDYYPYYFYREY